MIPAEKVVIACLSLLILGALSVAVASVAVEAKCLEQGYPKAAVSWKFDGYCMTLDGAVTVKVQPQ